MTSPKDLFIRICDFSKQYSKQKGLKTNSVETEEIRSNLQELRLWLEHEFAEFDGIPLTCEVSKGSALFPRIPWVAILPPEQKVSQGVYFVLCFGREGAGGVAGCISSVTSSTGLDTIKRSDKKPLLINVNGDRSTTKYNDAFANPLEITRESFNEAQIIKHIKSSLKRSFDYIKSQQTPFGGDSISSLKDEQISTQEKLGQAGKFDPTSILDTRKSIIAAIKSRQGQGKFRSEILESYNFRCTITDFDVPAALEAAHIMPYRGPHTNNPSNGLLLRADLHTLFDLNLVAIDITMTVLLSSSLIGTEYEKFAGKKITLPKDKNKHPSKEALAWRMLYFEH